MIVPLARAKVSGKRVLVSVGLEVPVDSRGRVVDPFRLRCSVPTLRWLLSKNAGVILLGHRGQPHGRVVRSLSLKPVANALSRLLHRDIPCFALRRPRRVTPGDVVMLENLRFSQGEEQASLPFAKTLAAWGDMYVNDDFSTSHRKHASIAVLPKLLPAYAGLTLQKECTVLSAILKKPKRPFTLIIGGMKIDDKLAMLKKLLPSVDTVLLGGATANTPLASRLAKTSQKIVVPVDLHDRYDLGPKTIQRFTATVRQSRTVLWAGPMGAIEKRVYRAGTRMLALAIPKTALSVAGGGDTIRSIHDLGVANRFRWLSTGGGAMLAYLSGTALPGLKALER